MNGPFPPVELPQSDATPSFHMEGASLRRAAIAAALSTLKRELRAYFLTPLAYVFIAVFLLALGAFTFEIGRFFDTNRAELGVFFVFHPWLYLVFLPAIAMRLWAEEIRDGYRRAVAYPASTYLGSGDRKVPCGLGCSSSGSDTHHANVVHRQLSR